VLLHEKSKTSRRKAEYRGQAGTKNLFQEANYNQPAKVKFYSVLLSVTKVPNYRIHLPEQAATIFQPPQLA
jgi:hypothetical protein